MDPLSVAMSIVGLLKAAEQISSTLQPVIKKAVNAPKEIKVMKSSVDTIRRVLSQLQLMLLGQSHISRHRTSLILVEQIVITLSACVTTFSELDVFVESLGADSKMGLLDRMRWATKTLTIQEHLQSLEVHKSTLTLMMTILTCQSTQAAEDAVDTLATTIKHLLEYNQLIAQRLASIEVGLGVTTEAPPIFPSLGGLENIDPGTGPVQRNVQGFVFEEELNDSWVYKRSAARGDNGAFSIMTSAGRTASWSMLSGLSLADNISVIAVQALPIYEQDLSNSALYSFGDFTGSQHILGNTSQNTPAETRDPIKIKSASPMGLVNIRPWWYRRTKSPRIDDGGAEDFPRIFGVPIRQSITYANVAISLVDGEGRSYIYGYVPIVVAKIGVYVKEKGVYCEDIFARSGSASRVTELEIRFDSPDRYGKDLDWEGHSVYDAATCLLRYLKRLPEPVIPFDFYDKFTSVLDQGYAGRGRDHDQLGLGDEFSVPGAFKKLREYITKIPPLSRHLLLYLLDMFARFDSVSESNKMTAARIVAAFQPSLLAKEPSIGMSVEDYRQAAETLIFMIVNQDHFLIGMTGTTADKTETTGVDSVTAPIESQITETRASSPSSAEGELDSNELEYSLPLAWSNRELQG